MVGSLARVVARMVAACAVAVAAVLAGVGVTAAGAVTTTSTGNGAIWRTVAQAQPTQCWVPPTTPGDPTDYGNYVAPSGVDATGGVICPATSQPKVNQAYVWGEVHAGNYVFFGTAANVVCLVLGSYLGETTPMRVDTDYACEFGSSPTAKAGVPAAIGDWRPPQLFDYDMATDSPVNLVTQQTAATQATLTTLLNHTLGIRSAGAAVNPLQPSQTVVFLAGPALSSSGGINVFAFDQTGTFLGATTLPGYDDIRTWLTVTRGATGQRLYAGVEAVTAETSTRSGAILRWAPTATNLFNFTVAGKTGSEAAYLAAASDRIYATTWPSSGHNAGLYVSPVSTDGYADGGLNGGTWSELWKSTSYEPDPLVAATYGGGALAVYDTYVYWGTMHVPFVATAAQLQAYPTTTKTAELADIVGTQRAISIFRLKVGSTSAQLLYGQTKLPTYDPATSSWQLVANNMGASPLYGSSGFGNPFNNYTWSMAVYDNELYVGTMDWSYLLSGGFSQLMGALGLPSGLPNPFGFLQEGYGADLVRFPGTSARAQVVSIDGMGNSLNYGVRNMVPVMNANGTENGLYLGMANPMNLATSGTPTQRGGWELIKLTTTTTGETYALTLSPLSQTKTVGASATVTASLTRNGSPLGTAKVTFVITSGPNANKTSSATTNGTGTATFQWSGSGTGTDVVQASASPTNVFGYEVPVTASSTATVSWTAAPVVTPPTPVTPPLPPPGPLVTTASGQTPDETAAAEFTRTFPYTKGVCPPSRAAVIATTAQFQDALSSQYLAQSLTTGTLLTPTASLATVTETTLEKEGIKTVYLAGGPLAISTTVAKTIAHRTAFGCGGTNPTGKIVVHRIYGHTQYGTAEAVAEHVGTGASRSFAGAYSTLNATGGTGRFNDTAAVGTAPPQGTVPTAILASGDEFQDAQAASVISYRTKLPLLLTPAATLSATAVTAIEKLGIKQVILMGGPDAVTGAVASALVSETGVAVLRIAGKDYTDTAVQLARFEVAGDPNGLGWSPGGRVMVTRGNGFTDGVAGAVLDSPHNTATGPAGTSRPLLLTMSPTVVGTYLSAFLTEAGHTGIDGTAAKLITSLTVLGGQLAVTPATVAAMQKALS